MTMQNAGADTITPAADVLHDNLDVLGVALIHGTLQTSDVGQVVLYARPQEKDCNQNGIPDWLDLLNATSEDCNDNGIPDECDVDPQFGGEPANDCNANGVPDDCHPDCNNDGIPDPCQVPSCDADNLGCCLHPSAGFVCLDDCDGNLVPDVCQPDCTGTGQADTCDIAESEGGTCVDPICEPDQNPLDHGCCDRDCNQDGVPDSCQEVGGEAPEPPAEFTHDNGTVIGGKIDFENYNLGALIATPGQIGQQGWEVTLPSIFGYGGGSSTFPSPDGAQIVTFTEDCSVSEAESVLENKVGRLQHDPFAASTSFWSWGVRGPPMHNDNRLITLAEVDLYIPTGHRYSHNVFVSIATRNQDLPWASVLITRLGNSSPLQIAPGLKTADGLTYTFVANDPDPPEADCWTLGTLVDGSRTDFPVQYQINGKPQMFNPEGLPIPWTLASSDLIPGEPPLPNYMVIMNNNAVDWPGVFVDNIRFLKASPLDVLLEDCDGNGLANGCEIRDLLSPDCNENGIPDECDVDPQFGGDPANDCDGNTVPDECEDVALDVLSFVAVLLGDDNDPTRTCLADVNRDGIVNGDDIGPFVASLLGG
jgi:hypothetical protein